MSHFTVMVVGENVDEQLFPYNEVTSGLPRELLEFVDEEDEIIDEYENGEVEMIRYNGKLMYTWDVRKELERTNNDLLGNNRKLYDKLIGEMEKVMVKQKDRYSSVEEFAENWNGYEERDPETNRYGYWRNPNAKWDWYAVGGRWLGFLKLKPIMSIEGEVKGIGLSISEVETLRRLLKENGGKYDKILSKYGSKAKEIDKIVRANKDDITILPPHTLGKPGFFDNPPKYEADSARKGDVDWEGMKEDSKKQAHELYDILERVVKGIDPPNKKWNDFRKDFENIEEAREAYNSHPYINAISESGEDRLKHWFGDILSDLMVLEGGREAYVERRGKEAIATFAMLKDGKWYEKGNMGWWGIVTDEECDWTEQFHLLFEEISDDERITIVDCHI